MPTPLLWESADGDIEYRKLDDNHLINILYWIKDRAKKGMRIIQGGGIDAEDIWFDEGELLEGDEVLEHYNFDALRREAKRRKLKNIPSKK